MTLLQFDHSHRARKLPHGRLALLLAALLLFAAFFVPQTALACVATPGGGPVWYAGCTETQDTDGGAGTIAVPAGTAIGDVLILTIVRDGNAGVFTTPTNFTVIDGGNNSAANGANDVEYYVYGWVVNSAPPANIALNVSGGVDYLATLMRFTGSQGWDPGEVAFQADAATTTAPAPAITTALNNSLVLRMGGFDDDDFATRDADPVMTGHTTISQWETADQSTSAVHAYMHQLAAGLVPGDDFDTIPTANEEFRTVSMALRPWMLCTGNNAIPSGGEVEYGGCAQMSAVDATSVTVPTPASTITGNYLLAVVVTDGNTTGSVTAPAGWDTINVGAGAGNANTLAIYGRAADADGAVDHTFTWTGAQDAFAYIMRFTGTDGVNLADVASATATGTNVSTPSFNTAVADTLVVRIGAFDNNAVNLNPATVITGHNNVTQGRSSGDTADSVSSAAAWINQASIGATGTASFVSAPTASEETRTVTLGLRPRPPHFRIAHAGSGTTCAPTTISITRYNGLGNVNTAYVGTIQLSTSSMDGAWAIGNGTGTLTPGPGDGTATYTFGAGDLGTVNLQFFQSTVGSVNFNAVDGSFTESAGFDPDLSLTTCSDVPALISQVCEDDNSVDIAINAQSTASNRLLIVTVGRAGVLSGSATPPGTTQTFNGLALSQVGTTAFMNSGSDDAMTQQFMMSESTPNALPAGAGTYTVTVSSLGSVTRTCALYLEDMTQTVPTGGAVNLTTTTANPDTTTTTAITTPADNSYVVAALTGTNDLTTFGAATAPLTTRNYSTNGALSTYTVSSGVIPTAGAINATNVSAGNIDRRAQVAAAYAPAPPQLASFYISHAGSGGTCGPNDVTITAMDQYGNTLTNYTGMVTLDAGTSGDWSQGTATNVPNNGATDDGDAIYTFAPGDNGTVTLGFARSTSGTVDFDVNDGSIVESPFFDPSMSLGDCLFRITHATADGSTCAPNSVTIAAYSPAGTPVTNYVGSITLSTALVPGPGSGGGDWGVGDGQGAFNNGTANDGIATYTFAAGDAGEVTFTFSKTVASTINFNIAATGMSVDAAYDANLVLTNCFYRISHDGNGDVCTPEAITITVVSGTGVTQTNYTGTVNITTATTVGDWSETTALGTLNNTGAGAASYSFHDDDNGVVVLYLMHHSTSVSVNINLNSGSFQEQVGFDPALAVTGCTIRFSLSSNDATACSSTTVTMGIYNSLGALATSYAGAVSLTTSTNHGTWTAADGPGLVDSNPGNGTGTYTFAGSEGGDVALTFTSDDVELINFNATANSGAIIVDTGNPSYDPDLDVNSCLPTVSDVACYANQSQANAITLPSSTAAQGSRMVLMYINSESLTVSTGATIDGAPMTLLRTEIANFGLGNIVEVYGMLDADLPAAAGDYDAAFTGSVAPAMCIVAVEGVAQAFPQPDTPANDGQINGNNLNGTDPISTTVTSIENNSLVISVTGNGQDGTTYTSSLTTQLWQAGVADAASADWAGHYGYQLTAGAVTVTDNASATPNRQAQIVLALAPIVTGAPAVTGYVPVTLYETFSGNINYRSIGNTLRTQANGGDSCAMQPLGTGSTATLNLPAGSTIEAAYLYWAGSGFFGDVDDDVTFGVDGSPTNISADDVFLIEPDPPDVPEGFFAAYKDVTGLVSTGTSVTYRFNNLSVRQDPPWETYSTCLGGWALVVVYENSSEPLNVINLFHGYQPFYFSAFTLVPRNFRMATPDGDMTPHAQVTHITFEGDPDITGADEVIGLQNDPNALTFTNLTNSVNPANNQYNSTVSYPTYDINLEWTGAYFTSSNSYGTDVDTYYVEGDTSGDVIYPFGQLEAEQITTRYSTSGDYVLLVGEFISVNNAPIADLEVFVTDGGTWRVDSEGMATYTYSVTNNGNGAASGGFASGDVIVTGNMPNGITFDPMTDISATGWDCSLATTTAFTCVFEIAEANVGAVTDGELDMGESLPDIVVTVDIADDAIFTLLDNDVTTVARMAHVGDYYEEDLLLTPNVCQSQGAAAGVQPDPNPVTGCYKSPQFDNVNDLNKYLVDIDDLDEKSGTNNNVHDNTRNVRGIETNLSMNKSVVGILETSTPAVYSLAVQNLGPDDTTKTVTVTDTLPSGLVPVSAVGTDWSCNIVGQLVTCTRTNAFPILSGGSAPTITITTDPIVSPAVEGVFVSNTATVAIGNGNFDTVAGNNSDTDITEVTGPLAAATEKFLLSVTEDGSSLGGLGFDDGDLVLYDPVAGTSTMFLDESSIPGVTDLRNVDALHLLPNGHVLLSAAIDGASIAGVGFNAEDIVLYDPILQTATLIFDGSTIFSLDTANIDAINVVYNDSYTPANWDIILSTADTATIGALTFQDNDIVSYDMSGATATLLEDGNDGALFNGATGDISALYLRYNDANRYVVSTSDAQATIAVTGQTQVFERGELVEIDMIADVDPEITPPPYPHTTPLFCDDQEPCLGVEPPDPQEIFEPASLTRRLDAVHVIESGYFGHFAITITPGDTCSATTVTIRKHAGLTHTTESVYRGSVRITNSLDEGTWFKVTGAGTLTPVGVDTGEAIYTFQAADAGVVVLSITGTSATNSFNVDVTNTIVVENNPSEDPDAVINDLITPITYRDEFNAVSYSTNNGAASFATVWDETNDNDAPGSGDIRITSGQLRFNNLGGGAGPEIMREIDFSNYTVAATPVLTFDYTISGSPAGTFVAEVNIDGGGWSPLWTTSAVSGSGNSGNLTFPTTPMSDAQIRFRISSGYSANASEFMFIDNVQVATQTNDCGAGDSVDHYTVETASATLVSCLAAEVTIRPHTITDIVTEPGAGVMISLAATTVPPSVTKGTWGPPVGGAGSFIPGAPGDGTATYTYAFGEDELTFPFYYTDLATNPETVTFSVTDSNVPSNVNAPAETATITVSNAGLRFFNEELGSGGDYPTLVAGAPSSIYPGHVLTVQAIKAGETDPTVCEPYFDENVTRTVELAFECTNPLDCSAAAYPVAVTNNGNTVPVEPVDDDGNPNSVNVGGFTSMPLLFTLGDGFSRAELVLNYADAGAIQVHGRHNILVEGQDGVRDEPSGDFMEGISNTFVVRPFAYSIDFLAEDRRLNYDYTNMDFDDVESYADSAGSDHVLAMAGVGFDTVVTAVAWQAGDDVDANGEPDAGVLLFDNAKTPNYGNETPDSASPEDSVIITAVQNLPAAPAGVLGDLDNATIEEFTSGVASQSLTYSEVGIIDLVATLVDGDYLDGGESITGRVNNVGRFIPAGFEVLPVILTPRPLFTNDAVNFTYLGEEFGVQFTLRAHQAGLTQMARTTTQNYFGGFAKLTTPGQLTFHAVDDVTGASDVDYSARISTGTSGQNPFPANFGGDWTAGQVTLDGNLVLARQTGEAPELPFDDMQIGLTVLDSDMVVDSERNVDVDDGMTETGTMVANLLDEHVFRYGRIRLENLYGSEIPDDSAAGNDLEVRLVAEYFDATGRFVVHEDDAHTTYVSDALSFVFDPDTTAPNTLDLTLGDSLIQLGDSGVLFSGETLLRSMEQDDVPLYLTAPGAGADGALILELNLDFDQDATAVTRNLNFLKFDWRDVNEAEDVKLGDNGDPGDDDTDNPRAYVEFGTFRGNDRIINWQEIFE